MIQRRRRRLRWWFCLALVASCAVIPACSRQHSETLTDIQRRGALRWGGDEEGGGPYIYRPEANAQILAGFEIDLMDLLAQRLGVRSEFHSSNWPELLSTLQTGSIDVVVNGFELSPARLLSNLATIPYYVYELHLFARADDARLTDWPVVRQLRPESGKWRIGVLKNTLADDYMTREFADSVDVRRYEGTTDAFRDVESRTLDATLTDTPAATFYGPRFKVKQVGAPVTRGYYVMYLRPKDVALRDALNDGLRVAIRDGRLKTIYEKHGIWNANQALLADPAVQSEPEKSRPNDEGLGHWQIVANNLPLLLKAAGMTVLLSVAAMPLAIVIGLLIALGRLYGPALVRLPLTIYVELIRGTPLLLQLYFLHFGIIPHLGLPDDVRTYTSIISAITALALNYAAYESEIYRAGLLAIPVGQMEAALALGLTRRQALWHVIIPQAVRLVVPPVTNDFINLFKDTSICSVIAVDELSKRYNIAVNGSPQAFAELGLTAAALYLLMSFPLSILTRRLEKSTPSRAADKKENAAVIVVSKIVKRHGANTVLDGVSMTVARGEVAVIVGPSGGGKSTLLRCINGLEPFQDGHIAVGDARLRPDDVQTTSSQTLLDLRRRIGMVFQQFNLFPHKTVLENVMIGPRVALKQSRAHAEPFARQLLDRVGLSDKLHARPEQLSGGQQQRVAIARALAVRPEAILFDEPTSALDPRMAGEVLAVIADLASQGQTMIVVTHAMGFARKVGHTLHVMHAGKVAESGPPGQIYECPKTEVARHFLAEAGAS